MGLGFMLVTSYLQNTTVILRKWKFFKTLTPLVKHSDILLLSALMRHTAHNKEVIKYT